MTPHLIGNENTIEKGETGKSSVSFAIIFVCILVWNNLVRSIYMYNILHGIN